MTHCRARSSVAVVIAAPVSDLLTVDVALQACGCKECLMPVWEAGAESSPLQKVRKQADCTAFMKIRKR